MDLQVNPKRIETLPGHSTISVTFSASVINFARTFKLRALQLLQRACSGFKVWDLGRVVSLLQGHRSGLVLSYIDWGLGFRALEVKKTQSLWR